MQTIAEEKKKTTSRVTKRKFREIRASDMHLSASDFESMVDTALKVVAMNVLRIDDAEQRLVEVLRQRVQVVDRAVLSLREKTEIATLYGRLMLAEPIVGILKCLGRYLEVDGFGQGCPLLCKMYFQYKDGTGLSLDDITVLLIEFNAKVAPIELRTRLFDRDCSKKGIPNPLAGGTAPSQTTTNKRARPSGVRDPRKTRLSGFNIFLKRQWRDHRAEILEEAKVGSVAMTLLSRRWKELGVEGQRAFNDEAIVRCLDTTAV